jgi:small multidrug resistance family-3 protein
MVALALFAWLLTLSDFCRRIYAAYGGVYIGVAIIWPWLVDGPTTWDLVGAAISVTGMAIIMIGPRQT